MDLIDRYLAAVGVLLPQAQKADIIAELRDVLLNRREEKEATLGRPLTRSENEALLKDFGNPLTVAGRYGRQQYLIGPELYPIYVFSLRIVLAALEEERYGYTLRKELADAGLAIDEGALYPMLRRLESQGLLTSEWREEDKRNKRFYRLSDDGAALLTELAREWRAINDTLERLI